MASTFIGGRGLPRSERAPRHGPAAGIDKKKTMQTISKLAHVGTAGGRSPLSDVLGHVLRAIMTTARDRRPLRPLQDIDDWSDQAEVAYYEGCRVSRCI